MKEEPMQPDLAPWGRCNGKQTAPDLAERRSGRGVIEPLRVGLILSLVVLGAVEIAAGDFPGLGLALFGLGLTGLLAMWVDDVQREVRDLRRQVAAQQALTENLTQEVRQTVEGWQEAFAAEREIPWLARR